MIGGHVWPGRVKLNPQRASELASPHLAKWRQHSRAHPIELLRGSDAYVIRITHSLQKPYRLKMQISLSENHVLQALKIKSSSTDTSQYQGQLARYHIIKGSTGSDV